MYRLLPFSLLAAALLAACSGDSPNEPGPNTPEPVAQVVLTTPPPAELPAGTTMRLAAVARSAEGKVLEGRTISWRSSQPAVAAVTADGRLTAVSEGTAILSATSEGKKAEASVRVTVSEAVDAVEFRALPGVIEVGRTAQLVAVALGASGAELPGRVITWTSARTDVATVTNDGRLTAVAEGVTVLTASSEGKSVQAALTVTRQQLTVAKVVIVQGAAATLRIGARLALQAEARSADDRVIGGQFVTWSSTNTDAAWVGADGVVAGAFTGTALVIARIGEHEDTITVQVTPNVQRVVIEPGEAVMVVGETAAFHATAYGEGDFAYDTPITWRSSDESVLTVDGPGRFTARKAGMVTITATAEGVQGSATVEVLAATTFDLIRVNGVAMPTTMFTATAPDGSTTRYDAYQGSFRITSTKRFEQVTSVWVIPENSVGVQAVIITRGDVTRDPQTGEFQFQPDDPALPAFRGERVSSGTLLVLQRLLPTATETTLLYRTR